MGTATNQHNRIAHLNSFLRGEMSAVETYRLALGKLDAASPARAQIEACLSSHARRVHALKFKIVELGGTPVESSGAWGVFAKAIEVGAAVFGEKAAISALEEGEDRGLRDYRNDVLNMDIDTRTLVTTTLLPQQEETHRTLSTLKRQLQ